MRVLVVGSGGREHALAWKISRSPLVERVLVAPGSAGMADVADVFPDVKAGDFGELVELARREGAGLVVVGPEDPLAAGISDVMRQAGLDVFGPSQAAAQLEASKSFSKEFMQRHGIPTARCAVFDQLDAAIAYVRELGTRCVVKADGLAAGKGVAMCATPEDAERALRETMGDRRFGDAGASVVIEEWLDGEELSYYVASDGERFVVLGAAQDHKRALDGDEGENTGGMGAYSPAPVLSEQVEKRVLEEVVHPTIRGMAAEGSPYQGVLFVGLMIASDGSPQVIEYNVRFGDPETQALMVRIDDDIVPVLQGCARGALDESFSPALSAPTICVVLASGGYPRSYETGKQIHGLEQAASADGVTLFHGGTRRSTGGGFETAGGRVLGVTARGATVAAARELAYAAVREIDFEGIQYRNDIAARALGRE